jgi:putative transposase
MPRRARLNLPGVPWHIIQRGNNRSKCFFADGDYRFYLDCLREFAGKFQCAVHAYVLMTNHVHLLLSPEETGSASQMMKQLGQRYVQYVNRTHQRSGTLWEGRFRSCLTQSEEYLLTCYRYIELNPVRAAMVGHPRAYPWSSYRCNAEGNSDVLITPHEEYRRLGKTEESRREAYCALLEADLDPRRIEEIRCATNGNTALGGNRFKAQIEGTLGRRARRGLPGRPTKKSEISVEQLDLL